MVGRQRELTTMLHLLDEAAPSGQGRLILARGEYGLGKTRLLQEWLSRAGTRGGKRSRGTSYPHERDLPYAVWADALLPLLRDMPTAELVALPGVGALCHILPSIANRLPPAAPMADQAAQRQQAFEAVITLLRHLSSHAPLALVLDDLHWSSLSSWDLLLHVARNLSGLSVVIAGGLRPHDMRWSPGLREALGDLRRARLLTELDLSPLDVGDLRTLAEQALGLQTLPAPFLAWLHRRTQGNPYFATEILGALERSGQLAITLVDPEPQSFLLPSTLTDLIESRLAGLSQRQQEVLQWLAVAGGKVTVPTLGRLTEIPYTTLLGELETLQERNLLQETGEAAPVWAFAHPVVSEVVYQGISGSRRQLQHAQVAAVLELLGATAEDVAVHYARAGSAADPGRALAALLAAADSYYERHAYREAATQYQAALNLMPLERRRSPSGRHLASRQATCLSRDGELTAAVQVCVEAAAAPRTAPERLEAAALHRQAGVYLWQAGRESEAMRHWQEALDLLAGIAVTEVHVRCLQEIARGYTWQGDQDAARSAAHMAMAYAEQLGSADLKAGAAAALATAYCPTAEVEQGIGYARQAISLASSQNSLIRWYALVALADTAMVRGHTLELARIARDLSALADELRGLQYQAYAAYVHGWYATITGAWREAEHELAQADGLARRARQQPLLVRILSVRGILHRLQGQLDVANGIFHEAEVLLEQGHLGDQKAHGAVVHYSCLFALLNGQPAQVALLAARLAPSGPGWTLARLTLQALEAEAAFEQGTPGLDLIPGLHSVLQQALTCDQRVAQAYTHCLLARIHARNGSEQAAEQHLREALVIWEAMPHPFLANLARILVARELMAHNASRAGELLGAARAAAQALGALDLVAASQQLLPTPDPAPTPLTPAAAPDLHDLGLTPRELEVLHELLAGRSNKEIASNLYISVRTAEVHVQHLMQKLNATSRTELVSIAFRMGVRT